MALLPSLFLLLPLAAPPRTAQEAPNVVVNPSLSGEIGEAGLPTGWSSFPKDYAHYACHVTAPGRTDDFAVRLAVDADSCRIATNVVKVAARSRQSGQVWIKRTAGEGGAQFLIRYFDVKNQPFGTPEPVEFNVQSLPVGEWTRLSVEQTPVPGAVRCALIVMVSDTAQVLLDDFDLRQFAEPPRRNLLLNGNAEVAKGNSLPCWETPNTLPENVTLRWSDREPHAGWGCAELRGEAERGFALIGRADVDAAKSYRLEGWTRMRAGGGHFRAVLLGKDQKEIRTFDLPRQESPEWTRSERVLTPQELAGATHVLISLECQGRFDASIDDVVFEVVK